MSGIYCLINDLNQKKYVGQTSKTFQQRFRKHCIALNNKRHTNKYLQKDWELYGSTHFFMVVLEDCPKEKLDEREIYWIQYLHANEPEYGYNQCIGGVGTTGYKHSKEECFKLYQANSGRGEVLEFDLNHELKKEWSSIHAPCKAYGYTDKSIEIRCFHRIQQMNPYKDSYWMFKKEYESPAFSWERYLNNENILDLIFSPQRKTCRPICQYDLQKNLIRTWTRDELRDTRFNLNTISTVCNHLKGKKTSGGYIWCFENYDFSDGYFDRVLHRNKI
jgi:group I intron endonuclease